MDLLEAGQEEVQLTELRQLSATLVVALYHHLVSGATTEKHAVQ